MKKLFWVLLTNLLFGVSIQAQTIVGNWNLTWVLIEWDMAYSITAPVTLTIDEAGKIQGNGGCNSFSGNYALKKPKASFKKPSKIKFSDIIATKMVCQPASRTENVFFRSLKEATTVVLENGELLIENVKTGNTLRFVREVKSKI